MSGLHRDVPLCPYLVSELQYMIVHPCLICNVFPLPRSKIDNLFLCLFLWDLAAWTGIEHTP
uniref:Uncharacterized protein n=1 Tax=Arundo donax TaxID=35708 RepID=A0A0A8YHF0_ARUDO